MSFGAKRFTVGSSAMASRSEITFAEDSMLRRSWLTLATARPSAASRLFCCSMAASSDCMSCSSRSARPISSRRAEGVMMRERSSGFWAKVTMLRVSRFIGWISTMLSAR